MMITLKHTRILAPLHHSLAFFDFQLFYLFKVSVSNVVIIWTYSIGLVPDYKKIKLFLIL